MGRGPSSRAKGFASWLNSESIDAAGLASPALSMSFMSDMAPSRVGMVGFTFRSTNARLRNWAMHVRMDVTQMIDARIMTKVTHDGSTVAFDSRSSSASSCEIQRR
eukprot:Amastigsp_a842457_66.p4 type:complete len:106 gc:universal Amastigsp_a842457_66:301-618(+)